MKKVLALFCISMITLNLSAQLPINSSTHESDLFFLRVYEAQTRTANDDVRDPNIDGTPFYYDDYKMAEIYTQKGDVKNLPVNYNSYKDVFYFRLKDNSYILDPSDFVDLVKVKNEVFVVKQYDQDKKGFFQLLVMGDYNLLAKKNTKFRPEQPPKALDTKPMPAKYFTLKDSYYLETPEGKLIAISNGKDIIKELGVEELADEAKDHRISLKKTEHLVPLVQLLNEIKG